jgi:hypothetical protein
VPVPLKSFEALFLEFYPIFNALSILVILNPSRKTP